VNVEVHLLSATSKPSAYIYCYYDYVDAKLVKPLCDLPKMDPANAETYQRAGIPPELNEENFEQFLPKQAINRSDARSADVVTLNLLKAMPGVKPVELDWAPKVSDYYKRAIRPSWVTTSLEEDRVHYTGGWTRAIMGDYIAKSKPLLRERLGDSVANCLVWLSLRRWNWGEMGSGSKPTLETLARICQLAVELKRRPEFRFGKNHLLVGSLQLTRGRSSNCGFGRDASKRFWLEGQFEQYDLDLLSVVNDLTLKLDLEGVDDPKQFLVDGFSRERGANVWRHFDAKKDGDRFQQLLEELPPYRVSTNPLDWKVTGDCLGSYLDVERLRDLLPEDLAQEDRQEVCQELVKLVREDGERLQEVECDLCGDPMLESGRKLGQLGCGHAFHGNCINDYIDGVTDLGRFDFPCPLACGWTFLSNGN
jgi:hypothetical protein